MNTEQKKELKNRLSKNGTPQLLAKLSSNTLFGESKELALEILEKRGEDVSGWKKPGSAAGLKKSSKKETAENTEAGVNSQSKADEREKDEKPKKEKVAKEPKVNIESIDETTPEVKAILDEDTKKSEKIRQLLLLGYSVLQISKLEVLGVVYQQVRAVNVKLSEIQG